MDRYIDRYKYIYTYIYIDRYVYIYIYIYIYIIFRYFVGFMFRKPGVLETTPPESYEL